MYKLLRKFLFCLDRVFTAVPQVALQALKELHSESQMKTLVAEKIRPAFLYIQNDVFTCTGI